MAYQERDWRQTESMGNIFTGKSQEDWEGSRELKDPRAPGLLGQHSLTLCKRKWDWSYTDNHGETSHLLNSAVTQRSLSTQRSLNS